MFDVERFAEILGDLDFDSREFDQDLASLYIGGEKPDYGTITEVEDLAVALLQHKFCGDCSVCYFTNNNVGSCGNAARKEYERVMNLQRTKRKNEETISFSQVHCKDCVYATQTNPKICMCPDGIAKHSYVTDDDYCNKGERYA